MKNNKKSVKIQTKGFSTHKQGDEPKDNQDAFSISQDQMRFAISDGASLSPKSGLWSRTLTKFFASDKYDFKTHTAESLSKWLEEPRKEWSDKAQIDKLPIPLKLKLKQLKGSVSTFVGCSIVNNPKKNRINILYVGDSLSSDVRGGKAAGWKVAWYTSNPTKEGEELADLVFDDFDTLIDFIS